MLDSWIDHHIGAESAQRGLRYPPTSDGQCKMGGTRYTTRCGDQPWLNELQRCYRRNSAPSQPRTLDEYPSSYFSLLYPILLLVPAENEHLSIRTTTAIEPGILTAGSEPTKLVSLATRPPTCQTNYPKSEASVKLGSHREPQYSPRSQHSEHKTAPNSAIQHSAPYTASPLS